ncbi:MAG: 3-dehydroquinate synthase [Planctomycetes bacterium]|nr:3-dehydroquinate synthase [Planctomycetota bacterium]
MRIVDVQIAGRAYPIFIGRGARRQIADELRRLGGVETVAIIADQTVADLHLPKLLEAFPKPPVQLFVQPGEASKSLDAAARLYDGLAEARLGRKDVIVTFGGGVACDLGGFVAATWLRGVRFIQVATSLEASIDASVGGKTAVNHSTAKNLIGVFHQPSAVIVDLDFLGSLPEREIQAGLAESVKQAAVRDAEFFAWHEANVSAILGRSPDALMHLISRNCQIKAEIVARDEREENLRAILNHGHTIGHALEHLLHYELRHGECVALGMLVENELAVARGLLPRGVAERVQTLLHRLGLRTCLPRELATEDVLAACRLDKKNRAGAIHCVLLSAIGAPQVVGGVADAEIVAALAVVAPK